MWKTTSVDSWSSSPYNSWTNKNSSSFSSSTSSSSWFLARERELGQQQQQWALEKQGVGEGAPVCFLGTRYHRHCHNSSPYWHFGIFYQPWQTGYAPSARDLLLHRIFFVLSDSECTRWCSFCDSMLVSFFSKMPPWLCCPNFFVLHNFISRTRRALIIFFRYKHYFRYLRCPPQSSAY